MTASYASKHTSMSASLSASLSGLRLLLLAAVTSSPLLAEAAGEPVGRIRGVVRESGTNTLLPAVTVVADSKALIGGARTVLTNEMGRYEILDLPPGEYTVEFSYAGVEPTTRRVIVRQGEAAALNIDWQLTQVGVEAVSVVEQRSLTRPDSTTTGTVLDAATMNRLPTARSYQNASQFAPGVTGGANPNVKGGSFRSNRYMFDGLDVTDPVTNTFAMNIPFESVLAVETQTGGMDAQYNAQGGVINVRTVGGSDEFHATASFYANHYRLSRTGVLGSQLYEHSLPFKSDQVGPTESYQLTLNVGGPIIERKLWYRVTYDLRLAKTSPAKLAPLGVPPYNIQHPPLNSTNHLAGLRLSYAPASLHRIWLSGNVSPGQFNNVTGGNSSLGVAESHQNQNAIFGVLGWDWYVSGNVNTQVQTGFVYEMLEVGPQGWLGDIDYAGCEPGSILRNHPSGVCNYDRNAAQHFNNADDSIWYQGNPYQLDKRYKGIFEPTVSIRGTAFGQHEVKFGVQAQYNYRTRIIQTPGKVTFTDNSDLPLHEGLCNPLDNANGACFRRTESRDVDVTENAFGMGFFVQDRWWTPLEQLTVTPGMRADYGTSFDRNGRQVTELFALAPRLGVTGNLTRDGRNVLFGFYGRTTETLTLLVASGIDAVEAGEDIEKEWVESDRDFTRPISRTGGDGGAAFLPDQTAPHTDELSTGFRREIFPNTVAALEYTYRRFSNIWTASENNRIWDPSGTRVIGWKDPTKVGRDVILYHTPDGAYRTYHGFTLSSEGQPSRNWVYTASYTLSWLYGPGSVILGNNGYGNPRQQRYYVGYNAEDQRHFMRVSGATYLTSYINLGAAFSYASGLPATKGFFNAQDGGYTNRRSPGGTAPTGMPNDTNGPNNVENIGELRFPDQVNLDLTLSINMLPNPRFGSLRLIVDVFNVLNLRTPTTFRVNDLANYGTVSARRAPLRVQLGLNYSY
jgi:hypothetical protein